MIGVLALTELAAWNGFSRNLRELFLLNEARDDQLTLRSLEEHSLEMTYGPSICRGEAGRPGAGPDRPGVRGASEMLLELATLGMMAGKLYAAVVTAVVDDSLMHPYGGPPHAWCP